MTTPDAADRYLPPPPPPMPTIGQMPRVTSVEMLYFDDEDCWRLALFAGPKMMGTHYTVRATDGPRLEMILKAFARIMHQQATAAVGNAGDFREEDSPWRE